MYIIWALIIGVGTGGGGPSPPNNIIGGGGKYPWAPPIILPISAKWRSGDVTARQIGLYGIFSRFEQFRSAPAMIIIRYVLDTQAPPIILPIFAKRRSGYVTARQIRLQGIFLNILKSF